jgi:hypothetical protein
MDGPRRARALELRLGVGPLLVSGDRAGGRSLSVQPRVRAVSVSRCKYVFSRRGRDRSPGLLLHCVIRRKPAQSSPSRRSVTDAVGTALARKLLAALGWLPISTRRTKASARPFIPLSLSPELTTSIALS